MNFAPIVLFVYNRPYHTRKTVESLQLNELSANSELFIYCDAAKNDDTQENVDEVRSYVASIDGFKKITIIQRDKNLGLDPSVIGGVTSVVNTYGKVIVLEDDLVTSPYFLKYMNDALEFYKNEKKVWHISGWNYPIMPEGLDDVFLWRVMNCWGWGTWKDRWQHYEQDINKSIKSFSKEDIITFNVKYGDFWKQVETNVKKRDFNWDIRWYATIFKKNGLCLNPTQTFVENIGLDGSGIHCGKTEIYTSTLSSNQNIILTRVLKGNSLAVKKIQDFFKKQKQNILVKIINKLSMILINKNIFR